MCGSPIPSYGIVMSQHCQLVLLSGHVPAAQDRNKMHVADCVCQPVADKHSVTAERIQQHLELMLSSGGIFVSHHPEV